MSYTMYQVHLEKYLLLRQPKDTPLILGSFRGSRQKFSALREAQGYQGFSGFPQVSLVILGLGGVSLGQPRLPGH